MLEKKCYLKCISLINTYRLHCNLAFLLAYFHLPLVLSNGLFS